MAQTFETGRLMRLQVSSTTVGLVENPQQRPFALEQARDVFEKCWESAGLPPEEISRLSSHFRETHNTGPRAHAALAIEAATQIQPKLPKNTKKDVKETVMPSLSFPNPNSHEMTTNPEAFEYIIFEDRGRTH